MQIWKMREEGADAERAARLARETGLKEWQARMLAARGADTKEKIERFLNPSFDLMDAPETLPGVREAAGVLSRLKDEKPGARIAVYGDYDVDGVCASAIMKETLDRMGFDARVYIPDRHEEGYGLNADAVRRLSEGTAFDVPWKADALVTVDCGITSLKEVRLAKDLGMTVIVTDHHTLLSSLPEADAVVSPALPDREGEIHFHFLCGAGVALKIAWALHGKEFALSRADLCALATVADVVPLESENRAIVAEGLRRMASSPRVGIRALEEAAASRDREAPSSETIAFQLAPRLNAAGRLESAMLSCRLMLTEDEAEAREIAQELNRLNGARRECQEKVVAEAAKQAEGMCLRDLRALVCVGEDWDSGVVGLAAGKLAERFACPTVCLARKGDMCVGSARSACGVDLYAALNTCSDLFERFGGHKAAAGLSIRYDRVDELRERLSRAVEEQLGEGDLVPTEEYDAEMPLADVTLETVAWLNRLQPFGMGNPSPVFLFRNVAMEEKRAVGKDGSHLQCALAGKDEKRRCIFFGGAGWMNAPEGRVDVLAVPGENSFNRQTTVQLRIKAAAAPPEGLRGDESREDAVLLQDLTALAANYSGGAPRENVLSPDEGEKWLKEKRGTLVLCRTLSTALKWHEKAPGLPLLTQKADDPRAFTALALYVPLENVGRWYRRIVLADGALPGEEAYLKRDCPERECAAPEGGGAMLDRVALDIETLRKVYFVLKLRSRTRGLAGLTRTELAKETGLEERRLYCALCCLREAKLIGMTWSPFRAEMGPAAKADPRETAWGALVIKR